MKILLLAPQPFYSERGTPIAIYNLAKVLGEAGNEIDLMTFPGGKDLPLVNTRIQRVGKWLPLFGGLPVGFSFRKLVLDGVMLFATIKACVQQRYDVIHAVEESVFIAIICARIKGSKVVYDMDSSMSDQLVERHTWLNALRAPLDWAEKIAVKRSSRVLAVCQALADKALAYGVATPVDILEDVSDNQIAGGEGHADDLSALLPQYPTKALYIGNLEHYQGVGLVLESLAQPGIPDSLGFLVIGGIVQDIEKYQAQARELGIAERVHFLGPRPVGLLAQFLAQGDILVSPRLKGVNTPMKIYTYLAAEKPIVATKIASHTQVLDDDNAYLVEPDATSMALGFQRLVEQPELAQQLAIKAKSDAETRFSFKRFRERLLAIYAQL